MKLHKLASLIVSIFAIWQHPLYADDQPPTPPQTHSLVHATKLGAALDQPGVPVTTNLDQAGSIPGKRTQLVRGIYPVTKDFTLYINGISIKSTDPNGLTAKGLEIKIAFTIKGGGYKNVIAMSQFVDAEDIPKLQRFLATMETEAQTKTRDDKDHLESTFITPGSTTFGFVRNGNKGSDYYVLNMPSTMYDFRLKSGSDVVKLQAFVNDAATWVQTH